MGFIIITVSITSRWDRCGDAPKCLGILLKWVFDIAGLGKSLKFFISIRLPSNGDAAGPRTTLWVARHYFTYIFDVEMEFQKGHASCASWPSLNNGTMGQTKAFDSRGPWKNLFGIWKVSIDKNLMVLQVTPEVLHAQPLFQLFVVPWRPQTSESSPTPAPRGVCMSPGNSELMCN